MDISEDVLKDVLDKHEPWLRSLPKVDYVGYGAGRCHPLCIIVYGNNVSEETEARIRNRLGEIPFEIEPSTPTELR